MNNVLLNYQGPLGTISPPPFIMTTYEGNQVRAVVVIPHRESEHPVMRTYFQVSLASSDAEALLLLYEESKRYTASMKSRLEMNRYWREEHDAPQ